ncbi:hypothetical protein DICPUDRAFT_150222 [Dictyostelium purpureum]|uniref:Uncharacterized protein n=1 Tax=Dictyostelium purpureum TaxID=5786 RepID=F0ZFS1_DICPU|nr:uncharacterized protein DICPUDRAFT_150222 [Dictyostelium purpureum]EGC37205.1 hypothetical protein DICPUDRAFT_150222 [Dictyostelium purpureum]|eukprot:XP_003286256.1 hypothetical protein DICPUDRAFT_150222 [Dictyostelium purpureum]
MISSEDFNLLQEQLISLKREKYEFSEKEKKLNNELKLLKEQLEEDGGKKKSSLFSDIVSRKGKMNEIQEENETLKKTIQQNSVVYIEQNEALKHNIKSLFETNSQLEEQILLLKKDIQTYVLKSEEQQNTVRKLQVDLAELHCTNEDLELKLQNQTNQSSNSNITNTNTNTTGVSLDSIVEILNGFNLENDELKEKITDLFNMSQDDNNNAATTPPSPVTPKEIIFHPLGEPEYNPDNEKEKQKLRDTIKHLMEQIRDNEGKANKNSSEIKEAIENNEQLNLQISQWKEKHREAEINRVKIEERLEGDIKKLREEYSNIESEKQKLEEDFQKMQNALQVSSKKFEESIEQQDSTLHSEKEKYEKLLNERSQELTNQK